MSTSVDILNPDRPKRIVIIASIPAVSEQTGWPIGFWWSDPRDESGYAEDLIGLGLFEMLARTRSGLKAVDGAT